MKKEDNSRCLICDAQATGFHFEAQSCSACAAFFRRTVALHKTFTCITGRGDCQVHYTMHQICRCCRYKKCVSCGMNQNGVQPKRVVTGPGRTFFTKSGIKRNKRFAWVQPQNQDEEEHVDALKKNLDEKCCRVEEPKEPSPSEAPKYSPEGPTTSTCHTPSSCTTPSPSTIGEPTQDVLSWLVKEEMKLGERRRIMFCERPVEKLLGQNSNCPFTKEDLRPLSFRAFRKSIRTHILFIYEWLQAWPDYQELDNNDKVSFLRKCVLFHTILDPVYISIQIGYPDKFVMQNGGYVSCLEDCNEGWEDEKEITGKIKRLIYQPLLKKIMEEIIPPMIELDLSFEEFVALKAFVSWHGAIPNVSVEKRDVMRKQVDAITKSLHEHYVQNGIEPAERLGAIILLLSNIFETGLDFVVSHRQIEFFDLWNLDSLLLQLLNLDTILAMGTNNYTSDKQHKPNYTDDSETTEAE